MSQVLSFCSCPSVTLIALGANLSSWIGDPQATIRAALDELGAKVVAASQLYVTPCFPAGFGPDYINAVARIEYDGDSHQLLAVLHDIEAKFGRTREVRWGQRVLDIDLLAVGDTVSPGMKEYMFWRDLPLDQQVKETPETLILPHPRLQDRAFVLVPLLDVAPDWCHPITGQSVRHMVAALPDDDVVQVVPISVT